MSEQSDESSIINIAINIFQNVGIHRWIEEIEILKNEQIYFEICKIIFPETIIHLFRLGENQALTTGQKIQGVIDLISKLIKNDLYHISGEAIANGKLIHLKNFLQLLQALSNSMLARDKIEVESAPENNQSVAYNDYNKSYYTVIGIDKEFGAMICYTEEEEEEEYVRRRPREPKPKEPRPLEKEPTESSEEFAANLDPKNIPEQAKATKTKNQEQAQVEQKQVKKPTFVQTAPQSRQYLPYPLPKKSTLEEQEEKQKWVVLVKKMNETKLTLEKEKVAAIRDSYLEWKQRHEQKLKKTINKIEQESSVRKNLINQQINKRELMLNSLKGQAQAEKAIRNLFKQQKNVTAQNKARQRAKQAQNMKKLLNFNQLDELLEEASKSAKWKVNKK